ncbi:MAG: hypothetical protein HC888_04920 [Candidatus Competibacteraceae bacterium]|nr:hypothetical protein [Candidatus Competibacteraceae bacterium]
MANKRVFISFAVEDAKYRDLLVGQAKNENSPFDFVDMSVKEPWDEKWRTQCRTKIKGCDGMIALVSKNTKNATGQLWEVNCSKEEKVPVRGIYTNADDKPSSLPKEFDGVKVVNWTWDNIKNFIDSL